MECYKEKPTVTNKITFYLYHIPGKKIGVTRDLNNRVTKIQGYRPGEYEVLDQSEDINYISDREIELQQSYGYKVDRTKYKNLFNKMRINATENTSTFGVPLNKLKGNLMDNIGRSWETTFGTFTISKESIDWILKNAQESMYRNTSCYIYNKTFLEEFINKNLKKAKVNAKKTTNDMLEQIEAMKAELISHCNTLNQQEVYTDLERKENERVQTRFDLIRAWAIQRGLYEKGDKKTQFCKLMEEAGELGRAVLKDDQAEFEDAIGDMVVVLTNLAHLGGTTIEDCIDSAYNVISKRTGKMVNGTFVKDV